MPEYLAPGVSIEEISFRNKSIEGVGTTATALVGPTRTGPLRGLPEPVTSFTEFERVYGDAGDLSFGGVATPNYTALAARSFFDNGGKQLFVARVVRDLSKADDSGDGTSATRARSDADVAAVTFRSRFPGAAGNYTLEFRWRDSVNLLATETTTTPQDGERLLLQAIDVPKAALKGCTVDDAKFPLALRAMAERNDTGYTLVGGEATDKEKNDVPWGAVGQELIADQLPTGTKVTLTRVALKKAATGKLVDGDAVQITLDKEADISRFTGEAHWGTLLTLLGTAVGPAQGDPTTLHLPQTLNEGLADDLDIPIAALAALPPGAALMVRRNFDIDVRRPDTRDRGEVLYSRTDLTTARGRDNSLDKVFSTNPQKRQEQLQQPVSFEATADADILSGLQDLFDRDAINKPDPILGPRYLIRLVEGTDGALPVPADYAGKVDEVKGSTALAALEAIEDISMVMAPAAAGDAESHQGVILEIQKHCLKMRYRLGIIESRAGMSLQEVRALRAPLEDSRLALYHPWVVIADPTGVRTEITVPPSGFVAGIYVRNDVTRGVHKVPANETVLGALRLEQDINKFQQELLNPQGINCLRTFQGRGHRVWGGRTLSGDPEWKYVNIRRYFNYLERSIEKSTQWAVFEVNNDYLWGNIRSSVEDFLYNEFKNGRLLGITAKEAYFVRCDRSTMTQNDIDNGRMVCLVGVAAVTPAEFVIFRIGQMTANVQ